MRRILTAVFVLLCTSATYASKHFILSPRRLLNEQEQTDLASRGLIIEGALTGGRFLVRIADDATVGDDDPRIRTLTPLSGEMKLHRSALREMAAARPAVKLEILFHDDVSFESAKAVIESAGGTLTEPLQQDFHVPRRISVRIASDAVATLAADEGVLLVYGPLNLRKIAHDVISNSISNATALFAAPYNLSGQGVTIAYFELAKADASHPEFGGRLTTHVAGGTDSDAAHATHTGGVMIAAGIDPAARGVAPAAMMHEFDALADDWLDQTDRLPTFSAVADNNSWGYDVGWCITGKCAGKWVWDGSDVLYGGYDTLVTAPLDQIARARDLLIVYSAGNDAEKLGPLAPPFAHSHFSNDGSKIIDGYCYSANGSGNDCPAPTCNSGAGFCETTHHAQITDLLPAPWISVGITASAKNVIAVGAIDSTKQIASFSSRGPTRDGRVKPDLVARGTNVYSTLPNNQYGIKDGTSFSAPVVTGAAALLVEQWRRTFGGANPAAATLKTLMIATADDLGNAGPDFTYGFGLLNVKAAVDTIMADGAQGRRIKVDKLATGEKMEIPVTINATQTLRVVLGWTDTEVMTFPVDSGDPTDPLADTTLVNDLDVKVVDPAGNDVLPYVLSRDNPTQPATRGVNHVDNVEEVEIRNASAGTYKVVVTGTSVTANSPQTYALVTNGDLGVAAQPCIDPFEPNTTPDTAYGNLVSAQTMNGRTCTQGHLDYFKFLVDRPGTVSVTVTATDTPVRVILTSNATQTVTADVAAGATQTLSVTYSGAAAMTFFARVEPIGTIGSAARYTITPTFPFSAHGRRRSVRRSH